MHRRIVLSLPLALLAPRAATAGELRLAMFELAGCPFCLAWAAEVGPAWPNTPEGRAAPLWRIDIRAPLPEGIALAEPVRVSPTFVLLDGGQEVGRITGYQGADFFWGMVAPMVAARTGR